MRRASTGRLQAPGSQRRRQACRRSAGKGRGVYFSEIAAQAGGATEGAGRLCALDILSASNYESGVLWEQFGVSDAFRERIAGERLGRAGYAYVVTRRNVPIEYPDAEVMRRMAAGQNDVVPRFPQVRAAASAPSGSASGRNFAGRTVLAAWATVPSTGWKVFVEQPESVAFAARALWRTILIVLAFVAAAVALSILLARRLVRPIKRLQVAAEAIGAGAYDGSSWIAGRAGCRWQPHSTRWPSACRS